jgi:hypothetical protein
MYGDGDYSGYMGDKDIVINLYYLIPEEEIIEEEEIPFKEEPMALPGGTESSSGPDMTSDTVPETQDGPEMPETGGEPAWALLIAGAVFFAMGKLIGGVPKND